ncbi:MAG TPA: hypothetical protein VKT73_12800 [Xanthobacteraceae bacterium]|nr:hypothetical protein [Xanthobacteraceae bacterium]
MKKEYLSSTRLGIREVERHYLIKFAEGAAKGVRFRFFGRPWKFDMQTWARVFIKKFGAKMMRPIEELSIADAANVCNTAGCIAGTMELLALQDGRRDELCNANKSHGYEYQYSRCLRDLFGPTGVDYTIVNETVAGKVALEFLTTGKIKWPRSVQYRD